MVSSTLCPAVHILGSQNVYGRAEGIADHYWPWAIFFPPFLLPSSSLPPLPYPTLTPTLHLSSSLILPFFLPLLHPYHDKNCVNGCAVSMDVRSFTFLPASLSYFCFLGKWRRSRADEFPPYLQQWLGIIACLTRLNAEVMMIIDTYYGPSIRLPMLNCPSFSFLFM